VHVDPVVGERGVAGHDEGDGEEVAEAQRVRGRPDVGGHRRVHHPHQVGQRHRRDDVRAGVAGDRAVGGRLDLHGAPGRMPDPGDGPVEVDLAAGGLDQLPAALPHHAGPEPGVVEPLDQRRDHRAATRS